MHLAFRTKRSPYTTFSYLAVPPVFSLQNSAGSMAASKFVCTIGYSFQTEMTEGGKRRDINTCIHVLPRRKTRQIHGNEGNCWWLYEA